MDWGEWGRLVLEVFDDLPALLGVVTFFVAAGALAAWAAWSRRAAARRTAAHPAPTRRAES